MKSAHRVAVGFCSVLLVACGAGGGKAKSPEGAGEETPGGESGAAPGGGIDAKALLSRESEGLSKITITGPGKAWTATTVASADAKISEEKGTVVLEIPVGTDQPVRCQVFGKAIDPAGTVGMALEGAGTKVKWQRVAPAGIEVTREAPLSFVHALYVVPSPEGNALGLFKLAVQPHRALSIYCAHDDLGYTKTFEQVVRELSTSLEAAAPTSPPDFVEVKIVSVEGTPIGFSARALAREGKEQVLTTQSATFVPIGPASLKLIDAFDVQAFDSSGHVVRGAWVEAEGGQMVTQLSLERAKGGKYEYKGLLKGKEVKGELAVAGKGLPSDAARASRLAREARKAGAFSYVEEEYLPETDPAKLTSVKYSRGAKDEKSVVNVEFADRTMTGQVDEQGITEKVRIPAGSSAIELNRAFVRGKLAAK